MRIISYYKKVLLLIFIQLSALSFLAEAEDCVNCIKPQKSIEFPKGLAKDVKKITSKVATKSWSVPNTCKPAELTLDGKSFKNGKQKCAFYGCANKSIEKAGICQPGDENSYFMNYGDKYCQRFASKTNDKLSDKGKLWLNKTLVCLQKAIVDFCSKDKCNQCDNVRKLAYASHAPCYTDSGLCHLNPIDLFHIGLTPDFKEDVLSKDGLLQVSKVGGLCGGQIAREFLNSGDTKTVAYLDRAGKWRIRLKKIPVEKQKGKKALF